MNLNKTVRLSMFLALAVVLALIESLIPFLSGFLPGLKLGLANAIVLFILYFYSFKEAIYISVLRIFLMGILRNGLFNHAFFFSLAGAFLSSIAMYITKKVTKLSIVGVSIIGSVFHCIGQVIVAIFLLKNHYMIYYLPWLLLIAIPMGIIIGMISKELVTYFEKV